MVRQARRKIQPLMDTLLTRGDHFDMNQLYRLIHQVFPAAGMPIFRPANSLAFPARNVKQCSLSQERPVVELTCLALYGVSSPLPHYFITDALDDDNQALRRFLGIFNQILYLAYFYAWQQKNPHLFQNTALCGHSMLCALAGMADDPVHLETKLAIHFLPAQRTIHGFKALLHTLYPDIAVDVQVRTCDWVRTWRAGRLGTSLRHITLGQRVLSHAQGIMITVGPVSESQACLLSPFHPQGKAYFYWVQHYFHHQKSIDLKIVVEHDKPCNQLGQMALRQNAFLDATTRKRVEHVCKFSAQ